MSRQEPAKATRNSLSRPPEAGDVEGLVSFYTDAILRRLEKKVGPPPRTFGFEYEFLPASPLHPADLERVFHALRRRGYVERGGRFHRGEEIITFEPGGQIEYLSPPVEALDHRTQQAVLDWIEETNEALERQTGVRYVAQGFFPGRQDLPLLLTAPRYQAMHRRFAHSGRRAHEMMKGTAAVHLHAALLHPAELPGMYALFCRLAQSRELGIRGPRQEIWRQTDPCRCGMPPVACGERSASLGDLSTPELVAGLTRHALCAIDLNTGRPFCHTAAQGEGAFFTHFTTLFTHVRLNLKGGTLELRTLDSAPRRVFERKWRGFLEAFSRAGI